MSGTDLPPQLENEGVAHIGKVAQDYFDVLRATQERAERRQVRESSMSFPEVSLLSALRVLGVEPELQWPIGPYDCDFYFQEARLCVEVDGSQHEQTRERDEKRDAYLHKQGVATLRIPVKTLLRDPMITARTLLATVREAERMRSRQT